MLIEKELSVFSHGIEIHGCQTREGGNFRMDRFPRLRLELFQTAANDFGCAHVVPQCVFLEEFDFLGC
jgi:hypothetical protein